MWPHSRRAPDARTSTGLAFTFGVYVVYDLARFMQWSVDGTLLSALFLLASVSALVAVVGLWGESHGK